MLRMMTCRLRQAVLLNGKLSSDKIPRHHPTEASFKLVGCRLRQQTVYRVASENKASLWHNVVACLTARHDLIAPSKVSSDDRNWLELRYE
jgi:hypothetical protein